MIKCVRFGGNMPPVIRTIGPLHLEDLEPHRFEDLIRQLSYDFRPWLFIEPTGRGGADDGYDARAWERIADAEQGEGEEDDEPQATPTRLWLIQCKRERSLNPRKLEKYLEAIPTGDGIYGIIFAAAADFSKAARDRFRTKTRELGFSEAYLWGKGELEDQLFQPKNDHLLFAYCGFSLKVRTRNMKTEVRARLSAKRKAMKVLQTYRPVILRDASDTRYPYLDPDEKLPRGKRGRWKKMEVAGCKWDGVHLKWQREFAFFDKDDLHWDRAEMMNDAVPHAQMDPWSDKKRSDELSDARHKAMEIWDKLQEDEKAWYESYLVLPYESILDFDADGDDIAPDSVQIYTSPWINDNPFRPYVPEELRTIGNVYSTRYCSMDIADRVKKFARPKS